MERRCFDSQARARPYRDASVNDLDHGHVACENASPEPHSKSQHDGETHAQDNAQLQHTGCRGSDLLTVVLGERACKHRLQSVNNSRIQFVSRDAPSGYERSSLRRLV